MKSSGYSFEYWLWSVYDVEHIQSTVYTLRIQNTSESDPHSYEATKAVVKTSQKNLWGFNGIQTHNLHNTSEMLYQLSSWKQVKSEFNLFPLYEENEMMCIW